MNSKNITREQLAGMIDHTLLRADAQAADFEILCTEAGENQFAMVAINSVPVKMCKQLLAGSGVHVGAAIAFPLGQTTIETKAFETEKAIADGADEIDYVINIGELKMGNDDYIHREMETIVAICRQHQVISKVIFENCYLTKEEIVRAAIIAKAVKPDFIKTSTGFGTSGATAEDVRLMKETVGADVKVKAAGGIHSWTDCKAMIEAGAERIGTSCGIRICDELVNQQKGMQTSRLFTLLPKEYVCTPDGMEIDRDGNLIVSCPNYADDNMSGCVIRIDKEKNISKWFDVPLHSETGIARNMGIAFDDQWNMYICDNQGWSGKAELAWKGRVLKVSFNENGAVKDWYTVADGMEHPNGVRVYRNYIYVTQSYLTKVEHQSGKLVSCVYRFPLDAKDLTITNSLADEHIFATFVTHNPECQYGADGIEIDSQGNMYIGNYGDGEVWKIRLDDSGDLLDQELYAKNPEELGSTDGMILDENTGNIYIADFNRNAIVMVDKNRQVRRIAQSPDCDGLGGELDQPGEPIIWQGRIIASCFDLVTDETKVNTAHEMPATMAELDLEP